MRKSNQLIQLEIRKCRRAQFGKDQETDLWRLSRGYQGEKDIEEMLQRFCSPNWIILSDYWYRKNSRMNHGKGFQADFIVITGDEIILIEVKNYNGLLMYKSHRVTLDGKILDGNVVGTMTDKVNKLREIVETVDSSIEVKGAMVFSDEETELAFIDEVPFDVVSKQDFRTYIANQFEANDYQHPKLDELLVAFETYKIKPFYQPKSLPQESFENLRKGINCKKCESFDIKVNYKTVVCQNCTECEKKSEVVLRMAEQLRYLYFDNPEFVTSDHIYKFCGKSISKDTIAKALNNKYEKSGRTNRQYYNIPI